MSQSLEAVEDAGEHGWELAVHTTRGALHATDNAAEEVGRVTRGAVLGTLRTLGALRTVPEELLRGVGHGALQGALEASRDPAAAAAAAVEAAREAATDLGVSEADATAAVVEGISSAVQVADDETAAAVQQALSLEPPPSG